MSEGKGFSWLALLGVAIASSVATLLVISLVGYYLESTKKYYPGSDFPVAWPGREQLGDSYDSYLAGEEFSRQTRLSSMEYKYQIWCIEHGLTPRDIPKAAWAFSP